MLLKNAYVAIVIVGFSAMIMLVGAHPKADLETLRVAAVERAVPLAVASVLLAVRVFADAVVCDLDDEGADRQHGMGTLPTHLGRQRAWNIALGAMFAVEAAVVVSPMFPLPARAVWAVVTVLSSVLLRLANPVRVRDWVDARLPLEAVLVAGALFLWNVW